MALFNLKDDEDDQAASKLVIDLNRVDDVRHVGLDQDDVGTLVRVVVDAEHETVPTSVANRIYGAGLAIADVLPPEGEPDTGPIIVEVRP